VYRNTACDFSFAYDSSRFVSGTLADESLIQTVNDVIDARPRFVVTFVDQSVTSPDGGSTAGVRVAVFDFPPDAKTLGIWRIGDQLLPQLLPRMRVALGGAQSLGDPVRSEWAGMKGYGLTFSTTTDGVVCKGWVIGWAKGDYVYEILLQAPSEDFDKLKSALTDVLWTFRADAGATPGVP
jgi:hypothetical protein